MIHDITQEIPVHVTIPMAVIALIIGSWHLYMFTLRPLRRPLEPVTLPYWIPYIGHSISFFRSSDKLIEQGLEYTNYTYEPFSVQLPGTKFYIVTHPADVAAVFKDTQALSFDAHLVRLLKNFGVTSAAMEKAWHKPQPGDWCYIPNNPVNPDQLDLIHFAEDAYKKQLLPGERMDVMSKSFMDSILAKLDWDELDVCTDFDRPASWWGGEDPEGVGRPFKHVSLYSLCRYFIVEATTRSLFGNRMHQVEPDIVDIMCNFNDHVWMVVFGYSPLWNNPSRKPQMQLMAALKRLIQLPEEKREGMSWVIRMMLKAFETVDIDLESRASMMLMSYWAAVSNEYNTVFWILSYMLYDQDLFSRVKEETEGAWKSGNLDIKHLCANSRLLNSMLHETLRLNNGAGALRSVTEETVIGGKVLQPGNSIMIPFKQLHTNRGVWGSTVDHFDPQRFLNNKNLSRHASYRPFGGGASYCPGRAMAKEQVLGFIAVLLRRFDFQLADAGRKPPPFPRLNTVTPSLGVSGPVRGDDVTLILRPVQ